MLTMNEWFGERRLLKGARSPKLDTSYKGPIHNTTAEIEAFKAETSAQYQFLSAEMGEVKQLLQSMKVQKKHTHAPVTTPAPALPVTYQPYIYESNSRCIPWSSLDAQNRTMQPFDFWMLHNPHWFQVNETDEEFCIARGDLQDNRVKDFLIMYATQFYSGCEKVNWRFHWLSGWG